MNKDNELDGFWDDYDNDNKNYRLFIEFPEINYEYTPKEMSIPTPKYKKKLKSSVFIKPKGNELF